MIDASYVAAAKSALAKVKSISELNQVKVKYLGRRSPLAEAGKSLSSLPPRERKLAGQTINGVRQEIQQLLTKSLAVLQQEELTSGGNVVDLTAPAPAGPYGHLHPVTQLMDDCIRIFTSMGYEVAEGPEIETDWYNFQALNIPEDHPARDMQDTFYLKEGNLPRTHTSGMQVRWMEAHQPPIRIISPGKVYRNEDEDAAHSWTFYQLEGLVVDKGINISHLKGTLLYMMKGLLGEQTNVRLRPNYFPYTEPSMEMDATCIICSGKNNDCKTCSGTGWLELGGAGMVHPVVLKNAGIDPQVYSGFAFGFGPERIAAIKYQVPDIREFWRPNLKFLEQF